MKFAFSLGFAAGMRKIGVRQVGRVADNKVTIIFSV
jgi:hypothetical protein